MKEQGLHGAALGRWAFRRRCHDTLQKLVQSAKDGRAARAGIYQRRLQAMERRLRSKGSW